MEIDPNGVLATPSVMIGRSSDFPSLSSPSRPACSLYLNLHGYGGTSRKCLRRPIRKTACADSDFSPGQGFIGTSLNDQRPQTWRIRYRWGHSTGQRVAASHRLPFSSATQGLSHGLLKSIAERPLVRTPIMCTYTDAQHNVAATLARYPAVVKGILPCLPVCADH